MLRLLHDWPRREGFLHDNSTRRMRRTQATIFFLYLADFAGSGHNRLRRPQDAIESNHLRSVSPW